jgi:transcription elongation factor GreB
MGRYRPPAAKKSAYITRQGHQRLTEELRFLWREERPKVTQAVSEAAAQGDRSENADYIYGKRRLAEIDRRVGYLTRRLDEMTVVDRPPDDTSKIYFGAWVTLINEKDVTIKYRIVGPDEFDHDKQYISVDSPVARALLAKSAGDEVKVLTPEGQVILHVQGIDYDTSTS